MPKPSSPPRRSPAPTTDVDPIWLLKAGAIVLAFALLCVLALFWTTFYYTQWQYVLAPSRAISTTPAALGLAFTEVHFGVDATGQPQLDGWWIPADTPTSPTVLLLHDGDGSMSDALSQARILHDTNLNVLLFDYRGYGRSGGNHPTQAMMQQDSESALLYLRNTRHIDSSHIIPYGIGLGASPAVTLCAGHPEIPAVILDFPHGDTESQVRSDPRTRLVPVSLLFREQFPLAAPLQKLATPKLLTFSDGRTFEDERLLQASDPKMIVTFGVAGGDMHSILRRFLDSYVTKPWP